MADTLSKRGIAHLLGLTHASANAHSLTHSMPNCLDISVGKMASCGCKTLPCPPHHARRHLSPSCPRYAPSITPIPSQVCSRWKARGNKSSSLWVFCRSSPPDHVLLRVRAELEGNILILDDFQNSMPGVPRAELGVPAPTIGCNILNLLGCLGGRAPCHCAKRALTMLQQQSPCGQSVVCLPYFGCSM